ncbi:MAG: carbonic anhydrase family protein, partial [Culicoidibacterales bacterium]
MKKYTNLLIALVVLLIASYLLYREYNPNLIKSQAHWTYAGEKNVFEWGEMEGATLCKTGKAQSPIDVPKEAPIGEAAYTFHYTETKFTGENNGQTIQYTPENGSKNDIELNGEIYHLVQFHFHNPSEHEIGGVLYPMEVHFVHKSDTGKIAVIGAVIEASEQPTMQGYWNEKSSHSEMKKTLNLSTFIHGGGKHYKGSLTTPPCSEGVEWLVLDAHQTATQEEIHA